MALPRRSSMTLFSGTDIRSHRTRIVLAEKAVAVDVIHVDDAEDLPEDLIAVNPYGTLPTLIDRELVLNHSNVIMEYLDERFPHPPLLPVYPIARAKSRLMLYRVEQDWYTLYDIIEADESDEAVSKARRELAEQILSVVPVFAEMDYFLSAEFSIVDCCIAPLLWRLPHIGIILPESAVSIHEYAERVFSRDSFQVSLNEAERDMRDSTHDDFE